MGWVRGRVAAITQSVGGDSGGRPAARKGVEHEHILETGRPWHYRSNEMCMMEWRFGLDLDLDFGKNRNSFGQDSI